MKKIMSSVQGNNDPIWYELLDEYFYAKVLRPDTEKTYSKMVRLFLHYLKEIENIKITPEKVTHKHVLRWRRYELNVKKVAERTWNTKARHMQVLYSFWIKKGLLFGIENPFFDSQVEPGMKRKKIYTEAQVRTMYRVFERFTLLEKEASLQQATYRCCALYPTRFWLVVMETFRLTGIRLNQLVHIRLNDIDFEENSITLRSESSKNHREYQVVLLGLLKPCLQKLMDEMVLRGAMPDDILFNVHRLSDREVDREKIIDSQPVKSFFRRFSIECGFPVSPHRFRHTLATILMRHPERNMQLTKNVLGHRSLSSTMEYIDQDLHNMRHMLEHELSGYLGMGLGGEYERLTVMK
ncbi:tyrosine-type recombinase/integrase [Xenorhabdus innexi]|uniref:Phage integrase n=1 Tax=Xenorhabdus innexi TaxID=290109 RepID=A0A1N6N0U6_9GAMM|nr:site-specific integrase [Xenorhabdus innexi]PHM26173.1 phage integrase [Xenorhabdus innexi]SIP74659.1 putative phage integrase [Xenorhabdus innexi]